MPGRIGALDAYDDALRESYVWKDLREVRNMRQVFDKGFFVGGALASAMTVSKGKLPPKDYATHPNADARYGARTGPRSYPAPDGELTFDKLSSVFLVRQPHARRPAEPRPHPADVPRDLAEMWTWMCPAHVYEVGEADGDGTVTVQLTPSNCVQCGAITAKGGRLTPPEGGSGPEYTLT